MKFLRSCDKNLWEHKERHQSNNTMSGMKVFKTLKQFVVEHYEKINPISITSEKQNKPLQNLFIQISIISLNPRELHFADR